MRWSAVVLVMFCLFLLFLAISAGERNIKAGKIPPAPEKSIEVQIQETMREALNAYPYLNTEQGLEATREIISVRNQLIAQGFARVTALRLAIGQVAPKHDPRHVKP